MSNFLIFLSAAVIFSEYTFLNCYPLFLSCFSNFLFEQETKIRRHISRNPNERHASVKLVKLYEVKFVALHTLAQNVSLVGKKRTCLILLGGTFFFGVTS